MASPAYMIATIDVKDYQAYLEEYGMPIGAGIIIFLPGIGILSAERLCGAYAVDLIGDTNRPGMPDYRCRAKNQR